MGCLVTSVHGVSLEEVTGRLEHLVQSIRLTYIEEVFYDLIATITCTTVPFISFALFAGNRPLFPLSCPIHQ